MTALLEATSVSVRFGGVQPKHGLYRARSHDGGDTFEKPECLRELQAAGEHSTLALVARADAHLWAKSYDGDAKDIFAVQTEVSQQVADALQALGRLDPAYESGGTLTNTSVVKLVGVAVHPPE